MEHRSLLKYKHVVFEKEVLDNCKRRCLQMFKIRKEFTSPTANHGILQSKEDFPKRNQGRDAEVAKIPKEQFIGAEGVMSKILRNNFCFLY